LFGLRAIPSFSFEPGLQQEAARVVRSIC